MAPVTTSKALVPSSLLQLHTLFRHQSVRQSCNVEELVHRQTVRVMQPVFV